MTEYQVWSGELTDYAEVLARVRPSGEHQVLAQRFLTPRIEDYEEAFRDAKLLDDGVALADVPHLAAVAQAHWHADGHNACVFASYMSALRTDNGWETIVLSGSGDPGEAAEQIAALVHPRLTAPEAEVVSVLLPHVDDLAELAAIIGRLSELPNWSVTDEGGEDDEEFGQVVRLGLRVGVEFGFLSEVLGFGPFAVLGATRRAPFTELAIRAKPPTKRPKHRRAFVAHYKIPGLDNFEMNLWWQQTSANRAARLGAEHEERSKARVTVALPAEMWTREAA